MVTRAWREIVGSSDVVVISVSRVVVVHPLLP